MLDTYLIRELTEMAGAHHSATAGARDQVSGRVWSEGLRAWLAQLKLRNAQHLLAALNREVALIDHVINEQVNAILHTKSFQRLEARWRGLDFLTRREEPEGASTVKIKVLSVHWSELARDFDRAIDFDQSYLFRAIYEYEFGSPGGEPFGILIGDYEIKLEGPGGGLGDLEVLESIAGVAAAAFCPFFANASPSMFDLGDDFIGLQRSIDHAYVLKRDAKWQRLRDREDVRFVGLVMPRVLMRLPYAADRERVDGFCFTEDVAGPTADKYLWGGAAFALGAVIVRAFETSAWPADIRGVQRGIECGGIVTGLPVHEYGTDTPGIAQKYTTDVVITDELEKQLRDNGFIPLCHCYATPFAAFYSVPSIQRPRTFDRVAAQANAKLSSMMQYMLCVSRFAHYIKVMGRDRIGGITSNEELERLLQEWLTKYVVLDDNASPDTKARYPLREAKVQIVPKPGSSGAYNCVIHLVPHYQLDDTSMRVRLTTDIAPLAAR